MHLFTREVKLRIKVLQDCRLGRAGTVIVRPKAAVLAWARANPSLARIVELYEGSKNKAIKPKYEKPKEVNDYVKSEQETGPPL